MPRRGDERVNVPLIDRIKDGRVFQVSRRTNTGVIYLRCRTPQCTATAKLSAVGGELDCHRQHSAHCYQDRNAQPIADFLHALKTTMRGHFWRLKELYELVVALHPGVEHLVPYNSVLTSLKRWRRALFPSNPTTLEEMGNILCNPENERLFEYDAGRLKALKITDANNKTHLLIYDSQLIASEFNDVDRLFIDGTFQTTPNMQHVYQLVSILGIRYDHALPFVHILMASKTQIAYTAVLREVGNLIDAANVKLIMTDFEQALRNASSEIFPAALTTGCNVHYDRALLRKVKTLGLVALVRDDPNAKLFIKKIMALAYLPRQNILTSYNRLKTALSMELRRSFSRFLTYYEQQWMRVVTPAGFSVYGLTRRTNNVIESYNSVLADKLGVHPNAWDFMTKLITLTSHVRRDIISLKLSKRIKNHPRYSTIFKDIELKKAWKQLHSEQISTDEFLTKTAMLKGHIGQRIEHLGDIVPENEPQIYRAPDVGPLADDPDFDAELFEEPVVRPNEHPVELEEPRGEPHNVEHDEDHANLADELQNLPAPEIMAEVVNNAQLRNDEQVQHDEDHANLADELQNLPAPEIIAEVVNNAQLRNDEQVQHDEDHANLADELQNLPAPEIIAEVVNNAQLRNDEQVQHDGDHANLADEFQNLPALEIIAEVVNNAQLRNDGQDNRREIAEVGGNESDSVVEIFDSSDNENGAAEQSGPHQKVSRSRKKNLRNKKRKKRAAERAPGDVVPPKRKRQRRRNKGLLCAMCKDAAPTYTYSPCGHFCCCDTCLKKLESLGKKQCPMCRTKTTFVLRTYA